jgi:hypothetical protein
MKEETIFIQIASYRDPELPITLKSCIDNANNPVKKVMGLMKFQS